MFPFFSHRVLFPHYQRQAEPTLRHCNYTSGRGDSNTTVLFTYIIGDIYIHFWSFRIRHHQTCYTVSLSLNCHFFMQVLFSPACQVFEARYSKRCTHTRTHTSTHIQYHTHQKKHSGIAHQRSSLRAAHWLVHEGMLKMSFFFCMS